MGKVMISAGDEGSGEIFAGDEVIGCATDCEGVWIVALDAGAPAWAQELDGAFPAWDIPSLCYAIGECTNITAGYSGCEPTDKPNYSEF